MIKKEFVVFGLGRFGMSIAKTLAAAGSEVMAVDSKEELVQEAAEFVTHAIKADVTDVEVVRSLGIENMDVAVIAIASDMESSIMATILAKESGIPYVIAKSNSDMHAKILAKVGADRIISPEREMGERIARNLVAGNFIDIVELTSDFSMVEMMPPSDWVGKSLRQLNIRYRYGINVIGKKAGSRVEVNMAPDEPLSENITLIIIGDNKRLEKIGKKNDNQ